MDKQQIEKETEVLEIHFDTKEDDVEVHHLSLDTFINAARSIEKVLDGLNEKMFDKKQNIQISILPPKEGTHLETLLISIIGSGAGWILVNSVKPYIKGFTGKTFDEWIEELGSLNRVQVKIFIEFVKSFFKSNNDKLKAQNVDVSYFPKAFSGRSQFYKACFSDKTIKGLEFCNSGEFAIKKSDFVNYFTDEYKKELPLESKLHKLAIISPIIKKRKKSKSKWRAECLESQEVLSFVLKDKDFSDKFLLGEYPLKNSKGDDIIIALFEYRKVEVDGNEKVIKVSVTKVYFFNKQIEDLPNGMRIVPVEKFEKAKDGSRKIAKSIDANSQLDLFNTK